MVYNEKWNRYSENSKIDSNPVKNKEMFEELFGDEVFKYMEMTSDKRKDEGLRLIQKYGNTIFSNLVNTAKQLSKDSKKAIKKEKKDLKKLKKKEKKKKHKV